MKIDSLPLTFTEKVQEVVRSIPCGEVLSYLEVARKAGNSKAARAVGTIMRKNYDETIPCHRVITSSGKAGQYNRGGETTKRHILQKEGIRI